MNTTPPSPSSDDSPAAMAEPRIAPPTDTAKANAQVITRHRMRAQRFAIVYHADPAGEPDLSDPAYALNRIDVAGHCTYVRSHDAKRREFNASVVRPPAAALPAWCARLGWRRHPLWLAWGDYRLSTHELPLSQSLQRELLGKCLAVLLLLWALAWWHTPAHSPWGDLLGSRYAYASALLLGALAWHQTARHLGRLETDLSDIKPELQYRLKATPAGVRAGVASASVGDAALQVMQGQATHVVHWLQQHPTGRPADPTTCAYRFEIDGTEYQGRTSHQDWTGQPFIMEGDRVRVAIDRTQQGRLHVVAMANLSDGHVVLDETDARIQAAATGSTGPATALLLLAPAFIFSWLLLGPWADTLSAILFGLCAALGIWIALSAGLRRETRAALLRALGADIRELDSRSVTVAPLPRSFFG